MAQQQNSFLEQIRGFFGLESLGKSFS